ncbi:hypothetical protein L596_021128 [Steinernema carpocapsae]|uniref:7TM GPCR serpentine receptor class x (Srx) domain-containing protein n=1 Tax=Steinernema carpocapsae TaxID=34508 RepID=A0A4V6A185_STECR|nr:hypothetical protein L596_021128 [Steinernema carpocapsae]
MATRHDRRHHPDTPAAQGREARNPAAARDIPAPKAVVAKRQTRSAPSPPSPPLHAKPQLVPDGRHTHPLSYFINLGQTTTKSRAAVLLYLKVPPVTFEISENLVMASGLSVLVGIVFLILSLIIVPIYVRLIYIFMVKEKYRKLQCYVIMIQMGIVQITFGIGVLIIGLYHAFDFNPFDTPWAQYEVAVDYYMPSLNFDLPYSLQFHTYFGYFYETILICTLVTYVAIVIYLFYVKAKNEILKDFNKEAKILVYAGIRFVFDFVLSFVFHYAQLPKMPLPSFVMTLFYIVGNMILPPMLYLCLYSRVRREFLPMREMENVVVVVVTTLS